MGTSTSHGLQLRGFISRSECHRPRIWRSLVLVLLGAPLFALGWYLVANGLPEMELDKARIWFSGGCPYVFVKGQVVYSPTSFGGSTLLSAGHG